MFHWSRWAFLGLAGALALATPLRAQLPAPPVVGTTPFQFGAYAGVTLSRPEHPEEVETAEVSELVAAVLAWGRISPRGSYLVELDMATQTTETWTGREADQRLEPVRVYLEYAVNDLVRLRAGRFLTPFGQWNEHHAEPLTWTPTRPLATYRPFAKSLTGVMVAGEHPLAGRDAGYALFWSPWSGLNEPFEDAEESSFAQVLGTRAALEIRPGLTLGASAALAQRSTPEDEGNEQLPEEVEDRNEEHGRVLAGADLRWSTPGFELSAEGTFLPAGRGLPREAGLFVQGAARIAGPVWLVARGETYSPVDAESVQTGYAGLTVRAGRRLVVKIGRQFSRHPSSRIPDGWFLSLSSLF